MSDGVVALTFVTALACGLVGGIFFAFSTFVMKALSRLPAPQGIAAMQSINITVINPLFMLAFVGTALACIPVGVVALASWGEPWAGFLLAASVLYPLGSIAVTRAFHIPRNDALAVLDPERAESGRYWSGYVVSWTAMNHVRTIVPLAASALFIGVLFVG
jgi:uncharacterized membrane protein